MASRSEVERVFGLALQGEPVDPRLRLPGTALLRFVVPQGVLLVERSKFTGITLAHNVRQREEVDHILEQAAKAGQD